MIIRLTEFHIEKHTKWYKFCFQCDCKNLSETNSSVDFAGHQTNRFVDKGIQKLKKKTTR